MASTTTRVRSSVESDVKTLAQDEGKRSVGERYDAEEDSDVAPTLPTEGEARQFEVTTVGRSPDVQLKDRAASSNPDPAKKRRPTNKTLAGHGNSKQRTVEPHKKRLAFTIAQICMQSGGRSSAAAHDSEEEPASYVEEADDVGDDVSIHLAQEEASVELADLSDADEE
ncbi:hypothetical protein GN244_ATG04887 [Phytophthora infestans]|uniref:Uncharacterized protein n=1 Tax=Phytophthora infestans TaxID=4787 RepID=A0A833SZ60_PHYIN|nr:hypothetical protein GN244_ATG04887 [Phytophthora infestans]KAI9987758.1 hypothetical protein PInf_023802 [Phytophthora infestans]